MISELLLSTAIDYDFVLLDAFGAPITGKVSADFTKRIKKYAGAWAAMTVTITEGENGWYTASITAGHTDTLGPLSVTFFTTGSLKAYLQWRVVEVLPGTPITLSAAERNAIADAYLDRADAVETGLTPRGELRLTAAASAGKVSGAATTTVVLRNAIADSKDRIIATVDVNGNRSAVVADVT